MADFARECCSFECLLLLKLALEMPKLHVTDRQLGHVAGLPSMLLSQNIQGRSGQTVLLFFIIVLTMSVIVIEVIVAANLPACS